ncbi:MAG: hypothetical protein QXU32_13210 [Nitrososphaerales archaeon]
MPYYIAPYVGGGTYKDPFRPLGVDGLPEWGCIDIRPDPSRRDGGGLSASIVYLPDVEDKCKVFKIAEDKLELVPLLVRRRLENKLNVNIGDNLRFGWKRLTPTNDSYEVWLNNELLVRYPVFNALSDDFNRADEIPLAAPWVKLGPGSNFNLVSNQLQKPSGNDDVIYYYNATFPNNQFSQITMTAAVGALDFGPAVRVYGTGTGNNQLNGYINLPFGQVGMFIDDAYDQVGSYTVDPPFAVGDHVGIRAIGPTIEAYIRGSRLASFTNTAHTSGRAGIFWYVASGNLDNWVSTTQNYYSGFLNTQGSSQEYELVSIMEPGAYTLYVELPTTVPDNDVLIIRAYQRILTGGTSRVVYAHRWQGSVPTDNRIIQLPLICNDLSENGALRFTLQHFSVATTNLTINWKVLRK